MEPERLPELLEQALTLDAGAERDAFLASLAPDLRRELTSLIDAARASGDFLEEPALFEAVGLVPDLLGSALEGETIGSWHLQALLHSGGMGSVFRADRVGEDFSQRAAFKLVKVGFESAQLVERFTRERQLLAGLEHPNIARLLDGGTTKEGRPWLAMDYIDGEDIDTWADRQRLTIAERLALFDQVLDAIAYLHQNLITHRDIKAANVLVDGRGQVKVLDFGIASLLGEPLDEPPAERRLSLATATDIYALGVLLYRLLAGVPPYRITHELSAQAIEALIRDRVPLPASEAASASVDLDGIAAARRRSKTQLLRELRGDLDAILARTLQKAAQDRYSSIAELREDLRRHRDMRPVVARAPSPAYRAYRFVQRHWRGLAATAATIAALAAGLGLALWQAEEARRQADRAEAMNGFMQEVLAEADPFQAGADKRVRDILDEASARLDRRFAGKPLLEAALRQSIGGVQLSLLDLDKAEVNLQRAGDLLDTRLPQNHRLRLLTDSNLAWLAMEREDYEEAIAGYQAVIDRLGASHDAELRARLHNDYAVVLNHAGQYERAIVHLQEAMKLAPESPDRSATLVNFGYSYDGLEELATAKDYYRQAIERLRAQGSDGEVADLAYAINNYGNVLSQQGHNEEALHWYLESLEVRKRVFGPEADAVAVQHLNIGRLLLDVQRPDAALPHLQTATELFSRYREADSIYRRVARGSLARAQVLATDDPRIRERAREILAAVTIDLQNDADMRESRFTEQFSEWLAAARDGSD